MVVRSYHCYAQNQEVSTFPKAGNELTESLQSTNGAMLQLPELNQHRFYINADLLWSNALATRYIYINTRKYRAAGENVAKVLFVRVLLGFFVGFWFFRATLSPAEMPKTHLGSVVKAEEPDSANRSSA